MGVGCFSHWLGEKQGGAGMRRFIVYILWIFGLSWLVIWGVSAMVRDTMPTGVVWAFLSMVVWWLVGGAKKEDSTQDN